MKILIVTKDVTGFNMYHRIAAALTAAGCEVFVVAEGISVEGWEKLGYDVSAGLSLSREHNPNTRVRTAIDPHQVLLALQPDVVMTELADPINLGESFGLAANKLGIRLGFVEDVWFVHRRSQAIPDFVCTIDTYGEGVVRGNYLSSARQPDVFVTGVPSMDVLKDLQVDPAVAEAVASSGVSRVILIGGQGDFTGSMLNGLLEAFQYLERSLIIPKFHPKWLKDPSKDHMVESWERAVGRMEKQHEILRVPTIIPTALLPIVTEVVSVFSNILLEGSLLGKKAISWMDEEGRKGMRESFKKKDLDSFPLVLSGGAIEVSGAESYLQATGVAPTTPAYDFKATERVVDIILR